MQTEYDPTVIQEFADRLYRQAGSMVLSYIIIGGLLGVVVGAVAGSAMNALVPMIFVSTVAFIGIGYIVARERAFALRLQAQTALCQVEIEINTRQQ